MPGLPCLLLVVFGWMVSSTDAEQCWSGNIIRRCRSPRHSNSLDCNEFRLRERYHLMFHNINFYGPHNWSSKCVSCVKVPEDEGVACDFSNTSPIDGEIFLYRRAMVFVYVTTSVPGNVTISFESDSRRISVFMQGVVDQTRPVGPFRLTTDSPPVHLSHIQCIDHEGNPCDVQFNERRPFAFIYYVGEATNF